MGCAIKIKIQKLDLYEGDSFQFRPSKLYTVSQRIYFKVIKINNLWSILARTPPEATTVSCSRNLINIFHQPNKNSVSCPK